MSQEIMKYQQRELQAEREKNKVLCDRIAVLELHLSDSTKLLADVESTYGGYSFSVISDYHDSCMIIQVERNNALLGGAE